MSLEALKRNRTDFNKLVQAAQTVGGGDTQNKSYKDEREWKPTVDKAGNGYAIIRFLPAAEGQDIPWVRYWDHGFKGPTGQWYIEKSLTSIGQNDPVGELNSRLWNSGNDDDKETARKQKRRLHYVTNVYIVSDPSNPQNEGKVMIYKFGKKIFDKVMDLMQPQFPDEKPVNPFDLWDGADFVMKIRNVEGYRNYDKSEFKSATPLLNGDDAGLENVYGQLHDISEFVDPKSYKSYDELKTKMYTVLGEQAPRTVKQSVALDEEIPGFETRQRSAPQPVAAAPQQTAEAVDEDDTMSYFAKLAAED